MDLIRSQLYVKGIFQNAKQMLRKKISQVLTRGGATVHAWTLLHLVDSSKARSPLQDLTHVFVDPRQLIQDPNLSRVLQGSMTSTLQC